MPKKGKRTKAEKAAGSQPKFKRLKNKHSAVESNINEVEHRGLDRTAIIAKRRPRPMAPKMKTFLIFNRAWPSMLW
jgi:hypothetical protein